MGLKTRILALIALVSLPGCGPSPQEQTIGLACQALKTQDWEAFAELTVTEADFLMRENQIDENGADHSFAGGDLRPSQQQLLREQFDQAVRGGDRCLDFSRCQYVFPALIRTSTLTTLSDGEIRLEEYIITIEMDGPEKSAPGLGPSFVLARWEDEYRILALRFPRRN